MRLYKSHRPASAAQRRPSSAVTFNSQTEALDSACQGVSRPLANDIARTDSPMARVSQTDSSRCRCRREVGCSPSNRNHVTRRRQYDCVRLRDSRAQRRDWRERQRLDLIRRAEMVVSKCEDAKNGETRQSPFADSLAPLRYPSPRRRRTPCRAIGSSLVARGKPAFATAEQRATLIVVELRPIAFAPPHQRLLVDWRQTVNVCGQRGNPNAKCSARCEGERPSRGTAASSEKLFSDVRFMRPQRGRSVAARGRLAGAEARTS